MDLTCTTYIIASNCALGQKLNSQTSLLCRESDIFHLEWLYREERSFGVNVKKVEILSDSYIQIKKNTKGQREKDYLYKGLICKMCELRLLTLSDAAVY